MENTDLPASIAQNPNIIPAIALWAFGVFCGFIFRIIFEKLTAGKKDEKLANTIVLIAVIFVWLIANLIDWLDPNYATPLALHILMGSVVGFFFTPVDLSKFLKK